TSEHETKSPGQTGWAPRQALTWDTRKQGLLSTAQRVDPSDHHARHVRELHYDALSRLVREDVHTRETVNAEAPWDLVGNPFWLDVHWRRTVSYHPHYGWAMQQNTGPKPGSTVFEAQAAAYSH